MTDCFALLGEPRRPWIDPEALKLKFLALAAEVHPDRTHQAIAAERQAANQLYAELNAAYHCLRDAKARLLHLLELERGIKPDDVQKISPAAMDASLEVSALCREADVCLREKAKATSPLLKVQLFEKSMALTERLSLMQKAIETRREELTDQMKLLNLAWESAPPVGSPTRAHVLPCSRLEHIYRDVSYLTRWTQQIQERIVQLSL
jgi:curved DNA-binding protein CbpA